jgi:MHS family proline/betaine transporter-like MFS transporter
MVFLKIDTTTSLLTAYGVFAVSFVVWPLGRVVRGPFGDRQSRWVALSLLILVVSSSTLLISFPPTCAQVGIVFPWCCWCVFATSETSQLPLAGE